MRIIVDYKVSEECKDIQALCFGHCYKCGACGRVFDDEGYMVDDGGTTPMKEED